MQIPSNLTHPVLILIRGLPGSGKSFLAEALIRELNSSQVVSLDPDEVEQKSDTYLSHIEAQNAEGVDAKLHLYRFLRAQAYAGIETHKIIIWNQPFTNLDAFDKVTTRLKEHASENGTTLPILVVEVDVDHDAAQSRVQERKNKGGHGPSENTFDRFKREYESVASRGYDVIAVHGQQDVSKSVEAVLARLAELAG